MCAYSLKGKMRLSLLEASRDRVLPDLIQAPEGKSLRADQVLYNDLIGMFKLVVYSNVQ